MASKPLTMKILQQLTNRLNIERENHRPLTKSLLVVFTGSDHHLKNKLIHLKQEREKGCQLSLVFSEASEKVVDINRICQQLQPQQIFKEKEAPSVGEVLTGVEEMIVPAPTQNTAIKLALGIQDQLIPQVLWEGLWRGIPLWMDLKGLQQHKGFQTKSTSLMDLINNYIEGLEEMGVKDLQQYNLKESFSKGNFSNSKVEEDHENKEDHENHENHNNNKNHKNRKNNGNHESHRKYGNHHKHKKEIITEKDILTYLHSNKQIYVAPNTIITPLALDTAKVRGIEIIRNRQ